MLETERKKYAVFTIKERGPGQKAIFIRIGIAFVNRDGSYNIHLDASPLDGKLHMREWREDDRPQAAAPSNGHAAGQAEAF
jgi:hypothetical protein